MARQSRAPTVLLTRPAPQSQRFAQELRAVLGEVALVIAPLMQTESLQPALPDRPFRAVILTSETGAQAAGRLLAAGQALPRRAFCVGNRTARAAQAAGFQTLSAEGDAKALIDLVRAHQTRGPLVHLRGEDSAGQLAETLTIGGLETVSAIVYAQRPCPLSTEAHDLLTRTAPVVVPVFSPRSARLLAQALPQGRSAPLWIVAISPAAAAAAGALSPDRLVTVDHPDGENMLHAVAALLSADANA